MDSRLPAITIRPAAESDRTWIRDLLRERWAGPTVISRGCRHQADELHALIAMVQDERRGVATYEIRGAECELVTLDSLVAQQGVGRALLRAVADVARRRGCHRLWLVTTNDNLPAQRFYTRCGLVQVTVHRGALAESRRLKPGIPQVGLGGVPLTDEIEFEMALAGRRESL